MCMAMKGGCTWEVAMGAGSGCSPTAPSAVRGNSATPRVLPAAPSDPRDPAGSPPCPRGAAPPDHRGCSSLRSAAVRLHPIGAPPLRGAPSCKAAGRPRLSGATRSMAGMMRYLGARLLLRRVRARRIS
ncbi:hypothetical protein T484DRAFT_2289719 [Baffinella frigidus]|nr:hypothetical protein T484DRAFT_2289719 [Cryptophyta sp. CCMP2293]